MSLMNKILSYEFYIDDEDVENFREWMDENGEDKYMINRCIDVVTTGKLKTNTRYSRNKYRTGMKRWFKYVNEVKDKGDIDV